MEHMADEAKSHGFKKVIFGLGLYIYIDSLYSSNPKNPDPSLDGLNPILRVGF